MKIKTAKEAILFFLINLTIVLNTFYAYPINNLTITRTQQIDISSMTIEPFTIPEYVKCSSTGEEKPLECYIGTSKEKEKFGYDATYVIKVINAEAGGDGLEQCLAIAQCIYNACKLNGWIYNPEEICREYQYTQPSKDYVQDAKTAFITVFIEETFFETVGDATVMYNPEHGGISTFHESQTYICTINDVKYFKENKWN